MEAAWPLVLVLWALRPLMSVLSGYVHPDEYFQNLEVMAADVLGAPALRVWEFNTSRPIRCIVAPAVSTGLPLALLKAVFGSERLDGRAIFLCSRLSFLLLSFLIDYIVYRVSRRCGLDARISLLLLGSSWPLLVLQLRPFSNSIESLCLFLLFYIVFCCSVKWRPTCFGAAIAVGFFARITFLAFAFPLGLLLLYQTWHSSAREPWSQRVRQCTSLCIQVMLSFVLVAFFHIVCDSLYYGSITLSLASKRVTLHNFFSLVSKPLNWSLVRMEGSWTVTPWNNIVYNSDVSNLSVHGLHPRILHSCVNLPLLFAPALIAFLCTLWYWRLSRQQRLQHPELVPSHLHTQLFWCSVACIVSAVSVLSIFPHQEARFLLPLLAPFSFLAASFFHCKAADMCSMKRRLKMAWLLFNVILSVLFGHLHQGGVVKALLATKELQEFAVSSSASAVSSIDVVFCSTYLAPRSLSVSSRTHPAVTIHDIEYEQLQPTVEQLLSTSAHGMVLLACPASVAVADSTAIAFEPVRSFSPHLSFEDLPRSFDELALNLYRVTPIADNKA